MENKNNIHLFIIAKDKDEDKYIVTMPRKAEILYVKPYPSQQYRAQGYIYAIIPPSADKDDIITREIIMITVQEKINPQIVSKLKTYQYIGFGQHPDKQYHKQKIFVWIEPKDNEKRPHKSLKPLYRVHINSDTNIVESIELAPTPIQSTQ